MIIKFNSLINSYYNKGLFVIKLFIKKIKNNYNLLHNLNLL